MIERDYYPLEVAAEILKCSIDDLIYLGAKGEVQIDVLVGKGIHLKQVIDKTGCLIEQTMGGAPSKLMKLDPYCLIDYEGNTGTAEVVLSIYQQGDNSVVIRVLDTATEQPLLMKNSKLVIYARDLKRLQQIKTSLTEAGRDKLLKHIGVLALVLAEASGKYKKGGKPNGSKIANEAQLITDAFEFPGKKGTGSSEIRESISTGIKLLLEEDW